MNLTHNIKQTQKIKTAQKQLERLQSRDELMTLVKELTRGEGTAYRLLPHKIIACVFLPLAAYKSESLLWLLVFGLIGGAALGVSIYRELMLKRLGNAIALKALSLHYGFSTDASLPDELMQFKDLKRGDQSRRILREAKGSYQGSVHTIPYYFCHLRYKKPAAANQSEDEYDNRYYLFFEFPWVKGVTLRSDGTIGIDMPIRYPTASAKFNRAYRLTGLSEMTCARFAKPVTVLHMIEFKKFLSNPNFTFSENGWLCVSFDNRDVFNTKVKLSLKKPQVFYERLQKGLEMPKMQHLFQMVHQLAEQHDDNFNLPLK